MPIKAFSTRALLPNAALDGSLNSRSDPGRGQRGRRGIERLHDGPMSMFVSGVELTPESEIAALRERANDVTQVSSGSANCTEIEDVPLEQFCMLSVSGFEIVPDGMECMDMECGESYFEITARLRQTAPGEWEVVGETASGLFAG
jgi:hypothetical protein